MKPLMCLRWVAALCIFVMVGGLFAFEATGTIQKVDADSHELAKALDRIKHCLGQLTDEQVWQRGSESMNSIGNLILHLCGNVRQWIVAGIGGEKDMS